MLVALNTSVYDIAQLLYVVHKRPIPIVVPPAATMASFMESIAAVVNMPPEAIAAWEMMQALTVLKIVRPAPPITARSWAFNLSTSDFQVRNSLLLEAFSNTLK